MAGDAAEDSGKRTKSPGTRKTMRQAPAIVNNKMKVSLMYPAIRRTESRRTAGNEVRRCERKFVCDRARYNDKAPSKKPLKCMV